MDISTVIHNLNFSLEEDICSLKGDDDFFLAFNTNQISQISEFSKGIKINTDSDIIIVIEKY